MSNKRKRDNEYTNPLSYVPRAPCSIDSTADLPYKPLYPLPKKSFAMYIVGKPGSGKTNLWLSFFLSKEPKYYRKFFDRAVLVSGSMDTLPKAITKSKKTGLPENQMYRELNDVIIEKIISELKEAENGNNILILDDVIKDIKSSQTLSKIFLNRRHITHDDEQEGSSGLSIMVISQVYNLLPLQFRKSMDHVILFKTENKQELKFITEELLFDLPPKEAKRILNKAWRSKYGFLLIKAGEPTEKKYFDKFDPIKVNLNDDDDEEDYESE